jgi:hypothetical protein
MATIIPDGLVCLAGIHFRNGSQWHTYLEESREKNGVTQAGRSDPHGREKIREEMKTAHEDAGDAASPRRSSNRVVYKQISSLAGLGLLEACSFGIIIPMLPIVTTEVSHESVSIAAMRAWRSNGLSCYPL